MKTWIRSIVPRSLWQIAVGLRGQFFPAYRKESYSQEGEDLVLARFLEQGKAGFYVDVGAHHPIRYSNTYGLYRKGWRGLNIDANPGSMKAFHRVRPRDINVEAAVSNTPSELIFYIFNDPAMNTLDKELASRHTSGGYHIINEVKIKTQKLSDLLDQYLPPNTRIDVLTIDVEGLDYDVLRSNDWVRYSPEFILVECLGFSLNQISSDPIARFLSDRHYSVVAKTLNTVFFRLSSKCSPETV